MPTSSISRPSKIYPNLDFLFENICTIWQPCSQEPQVVPDQLPGRQLAGESGVGAAQELLRRSQTFSGPRSSLPKVTNIGLQMFVVTKIFLNLRTVHFL
jgi:hypothetical protein